MFIKNLFKFNRLYSIVFAGFVLLFVFLNLKKGLIATPIYQFGMYRGIMHKTDTLYVLHIYLNNKKLDVSKYDFPIRDILVCSVLNYQKSSHINVEIYQTFESIFNRIGYSNISNESFFTNNINDTQFLKWYKTYLEKIVIYPISKIEIFSQKYVWKCNTIESILTEKKIFKLDTF